MVNAQIEGVKASVAGKVYAFEVRWSLHAWEPYGVSALLNRSNSEGSASFGGTDACGKACGQSAVG